jgi:hypothetical protein
LVPGNESFPILETLKHLLNQLLNVKQCIGIFVMELARITLNINSAEI